MFTMQLLILFMFLNLHADNIMLARAEDSANVPLFICKGTDLESIGNALQIPHAFMDIIGKNYTFSLNVSNDDIDCDSAERFNYTVNLNDSKDAKPLFSTHGILIMKIASNRFFRPSKDFCIQSLDENAVLTLSVCNGSCENGNKKLCIKKCCNIHKVLGYDPEDPEVASCQLPNQGHSNLDWKPMVYHDPSTKLSEDEHLAIESNVYNDFNFGGCVSMQVLFETHPEFGGDYTPSPSIGRFRLLADGNVAICGERGEWSIFDDSTYCIDSLQNFGYGSNSSSGNLTTQVLIRCLDKIMHTEHFKEIIYQILMPVASFFLLMVIVVYSLILDEQCAYGYTVYSYTWSLFLVNTILSLQHFLDIKHGTLACKSLGVAFHFFFISTFCFLTTINFNIFIKFRTSNSTRRTEAKHMGRFLLYILFSVMVPMVIISIGLLLDAYAAPEETSCDIKRTVLVTPRYGEKVCGVDSDSQGWYIYFPVGLLLGFNLIFFSTTLYNVHQTKTRLNTHINGNSTSRYQPLMLFGRLFIVMGISWTLDFVGWTLKQHHLIYSSTVEFIFIFDCINVLQAIAIFYLFVCKKQIVQQLKRKHLWLRPLLSFNFCQNLPDKRTSLTSQESTVGKFWSSRKTSITSILNRLSRKGSKMEVDNEPQLEQ